MWRTRSAAGLAAARPRSTASTELVLRARLTWRQVVVLRGRAQVPARRPARSFSPGATWSRPSSPYPEIAPWLVELFESRFSPALTCPSGA